MTHIAIAINTVEDDDLPYALSKHLAFPATFDNAGQVVITLYDSVIGADRSFRIERSQMRLIKRGEKPKDRRPEIEDYVQIVGRKRGGVISRYHFQTGFEIRLGNGAKHEIAAADMTYDDVRGIWYYSEQ